jgi:anti-sigma regulatory factor (Ser/Thr protein kinase)
VPETSHASLTTDEGMTAQTRIFDAARDDVVKIDEWIETIGRRWGENQRTVFAARLCVAELAANVIEHGGAKPGRDRIIVTLAKCADGIAIEFQDSCARFDPTVETIAERPDTIESAAINGRGLMLIRAYAKEFAYRHDGTYNRVTLRVGLR